MSRIALPWIYEYLNDFVASAGRRIANVPDINIIMLLVITSNLNNVKLLNIINIEIFLH